MLGKTNSKAANVLPCEYANIVLVTNQPSHEDAVGVVVNVSYEDFNKDYVWEGKELTVKVPEGMEYTVSFSDVDGYASPSAVSYKAVADNARDIEGLYCTEAVTVVVSADGDAVDAPIMVDGVSYTGSEIHHKVPFGRVYEVVPGEVSGYVTPVSQSFTADSASRLVEVVYVASSLTVEILSNQLDDLVIGAVRATVSYGDMSVQVANGEKVTVPVGSEVTISFPEVEGYRTPDAVVYTHTGGDVVKSGTYETELVTVNVTADQGTVTGFEVTLKDSSTGAVIATQTTAVETYKIPFGVDYSVTAGSVDGYVTPASQSFVSALSDRNVNVVYEVHAGTKNPTNGVWIQDTDGYFHTEAEWDRTYTADCVAVIISNRRFEIALTEASNTMQIHSSYSGALENYMTARTDETQARADYNGATNTTNIMKLQSSTNYAAGWCNAFSFPSGKKGFLPALGELYHVYLNKAAVDAALTKAGGTALNTAYYWTSTFWGVDGQNRYCWILNWSNGFVTGSPITSRSRVRAFAAI